MANPETTSTSAGADQTSATPGAKRNDEPQVLTDDDGFPIVATDADLREPASAAATVGVAAPASNEDARRTAPELAQQRSVGGSPIAGHHYRRTVRIVRRVQLWSVFKVALLGSIVLYGICLLSAAVLWSLATSGGQVHHVEKFMRDVGFKNWTFDGPTLFQAVAFLGAVGMVVTSVMLTLAAAIMNVVSELTGGIRFTLIETEAPDDSRAPSAP